MISLSPTKRMGKTLFELGRFDDAERFLDPIADKAADPEIYECMVSINTNRNQQLENLPILKKLAELRPEESK